MVNFFKLAMPFLKSCAAEILGIWDAPPPPTFTDEPYEKNMKPCALWE